MERVTSSTPAQVLARRRNWFMRNLVGWLAQLRGGFVSMADPEDDLDIKFAIEALERVDARRIERKAKRRHLTRGYCWRTEDDPPAWGIYGHFDDQEAIEIVEAYEGDSFFGAPKVARSYGRMVPCRRDGCDCDGGSHLERAEPGPGASPYTWVSR